MMINLMQGDCLERMKEIETGKLMIGGSNSTCPNLARSLKVMSFSFSLLSGIWLYSQLFSGSGSLGNSICNAFTTGTIEDRFSPLSDLPKSQPRQFTPITLPPLKTGPPLAPPLILMLVLKCGYGIKGPLCACSKNFPSK